jgi:hypothetical protein
VLKKRNKGTAPKEKQCRNKRQTDTVKTVTILELNKVYIENRHREENVKIDREERAER